MPSLYHVGFWVRDIEKSRHFYKDFLGYEEPYVLNRPNGNLQMVVMKVNERQVIYLFPDATRILANGDNLDHLGLETDNIAAAREHLVTRHIAVGNPTRGRIGDLLLGVKDPDEHLFELTQFDAEGQLLQHQGKSLAPERISRHLRSATLSVADLPAALAFYVGILGFKKIEDESSKRSDLVRVEVPDGNDYLELVPYERKPGAERARAVPAFTLEVVDAVRARETLAARAKALGLSAPEPLMRTPRGERFTRCQDPDGTEVRFVEALPRTSEKL